MKYGFQVSLSYGRPQFGLLDDELKVAYGNNTFFAEYQMKNSGWRCHPGFVNSLLTLLENGESSGLLVSNVVKFPPLAIDST